MFIVCSYEFGLAASQGLALRAQPARFWGVFGGVAIDHIWSGRVASAGISFCHTIIKNLIQE
jgi:hypothetical protein